jgi:hypothetical protein
MEGGRWKPLVGREGTVYFSVWIFCLKLPLAIFGDRTGRR